jgi:diacylglycerol kinase (ATP)
MHGRPPGPITPTAASFKNARFHLRLGYALSGIATVFRRERSFRTQCLFAFAGSGAVAALRVSPLWAAVVALSIGLVLALEVANAALEYLIDHVHPEIAVEIARAKDAAAGAVLIGSLASLVVAALLIADWSGSA